MSHCGVCKKSCEDGVNSAKCVSCEGVFHVECLKKQDGEIVKSRSCKDWKCKECRQTASSNDSSSPNTVITKDFLLKVMENFKNEIFIELKSVKNETLELKVSVQHLSDSMDDITKQFSDFQKELNKVKAENQELRGGNILLNRRVTELEERVRDLEQYSRKNNVEISGIPKTPNEDVKTIVREVGKALGVEVQPSQIAAAHRIPSYNKTRVPSLVVQFTERTMKEAFITKFKESRSQSFHLTANKVNHNFPNDRVYVNDHLSPENKVFFAKLKAKCKELGYAFVWCRDGKFFIRKSAGERAIKVSTYQGIDQIK
jgi:archaellum component FlaC